MQLLDEGVVYKGRHPSFYSQGSKFIQDVMKKLDNSVFSWVPRYFGLLNSMKIFALKIVKY